MGTGHESMTLYSVPSPKRVVSPGSSFWRGGQAGSHQGLPAHPVTPSYLCIPGEPPSVQAASPRPLRPPSLRAWLPVCPGCVSGLTRQDADGDRWLGTLAGAQTEAGTSSTR